MLFALIQTSVFPLFFSPGWRPSLILLLVLYIGVREHSSMAVISGLFLGAMQDSFSGHTVGLYVTVYLAILLIVRALSEHLNVESTPLLLGLVVAGTAVQNLLLWFSLTIFTETSAIFSLLLTTAPRQVIVNVLCAIVLLALLSMLRRSLGLRHSQSVFVFLGRFHGD
jgi:rod shape-determining protein MreD